MSEEKKLIEITVKLPESEFRAIDQFKVLIYDDADIYEMYREAILPMLTAIGYGTRSIIDGAASLCDELDSVLKSEQGV